MTIETMTDVAHTSQRMKSVMREAKLFHHTPDYMREGFETVIRSIALAVNGASTDRTLLKESIHALQSVLLELDAETERFNLRDTHTAERS